jgi:hypothetical protein
MLNPSIPKWLPLILLLAIVLCTLFVLPPHISSDSASYLKAMDVLGGAPVAHDFRANRILTTFGGLEVAVVLTKLIGSSLVSWYLMNSLFFIFGMWCFYLFLREFISDEKGLVALIGMILLATNYVVISFGLNYLMDMGGWFFYILGLFFSYRFYTSGKVSYLWTAAFLIGFGGLFKEYALFASIPFVVALLFREYKNPVKLLLRSLGAFVLGVIPITLLYFYVYKIYGYTYADWFSFNQGRYGLSYSSRIIEYIKVFGSLFTFAWFLILPGVYFVIRQGKELLGKEKMIFLFGIFLSALPIFAWPAITQRIFFVPVVFGIIVATIFLKREESRLLLYIPLVLLYVLAGYGMDHYILPNVNLDVLLKRI